MNIEDMEKLARKACAKHVVVDWKNLEDEDGKPIDFSTDKALELFEKYPDFYTIVKDVAGEAELFRQVEDEEAAKNSAATCDGNSNGESTKNNSSSNSEQESV